MSDLEKLKQWLETYPHFDVISQFSVDYTDQVPANGGVFPAGLVEIERRQDILGNITVSNQYNFGLYYVFAKSPGDAEGSQLNADWVMDFQRWVQDQNIAKKTPVFGNIDTENERIKAENGILMEAEAEGTATYMVQLSASFKTYYEVI